MSDRVRPEPAKYKTTNWRRYNQALKARGALMIWLDRDLQWSGLANGERGRPSLFSDAAIQFCLTIKGLFGLALRQAMGMVESLLKLAGLSWQEPDYSTVCRRRKTLKVRIPYRPAAQGLHLLVDSTGLKMMGEGEWKRKKHGAEYRRQWRKLHLGLDAQMLEIRAIEVTPNSVGDAPVLSSLLGQIDPDEALLSVSGDGAYDTKACHEERWSGYHRRSLVETKMRCVKLMGERVMARDFDRQVAELQVRAAILNRFTQLGTPETVRVA
ncbi:IS5 family transposase [Malikia sp.]|uniref:IS5 family transposase n=1 Tax=Malikia sp. TaxID=2070706 RepID=UPI00261CA5AC|nr:IS5 family transposase [Malikia sp.]MDD2729295.1 IS5 family transposase [Malikia sp.]